MRDLIYFMLQSSVLIGLVLTVRKVGRRYLSSRVCYMLWLIPMVRLLWPFSLYTISDVNTANSWHPYAWVMELTEEMGTIGELRESREGDYLTGDRLVSEWDKEMKEEHDQREDTLTPNHGSIAQTITSKEPVQLSEIPSNTEISIESSHFSAQSPSIPDTQENLSENPLSTSRSFHITWQGVLGIVWITGVVILSVLFLIQNLHFFRKLQKFGQKLDGVMPVSSAVSKVSKRKLKVYCAEWISSPCLYGCLSPKILLTPSAMKNQTTQDMVLLHEMMHYKQKDHIWTCIRNLLCIVYWFHPLVWVGAAASRADAELSCDSRVTAEMKKEEKIQYGTALLELLSVHTGRKRILEGTTAMAAGTTEINRRIHQIAKPYQTRKSILSVTLLLLLLCGGISCTKVEGNEAYIASENNNDKNGQEERNATKVTKDSEEIEEIENVEDRNDIENRKDREESDNLSDSETANAAQEIEIDKKEALFSGATPLGASGPILQYIDDEVILFSDYFGLVTLQYGNLNGEEPRIIDTLDLKSLGCGDTQGDQAADIRVSKDGRMVYIRRVEDTTMYRYDRETKRLYQGDSSMLPDEEDLDTHVKEWNNSYQADSGTYGIDLWQYTTKEWDIGTLKMSVRGETVVGVWTESSKEPVTSKRTPFDTVVEVWTESSCQYMMNLKTAYDNGDTSVVDNGWNGEIIRTPVNLNGGTSEWQSVLVTVDKNGNKKANEYE